MLAECIMYRRQLCSARLELQGAVSDSPSGAATAGQAGRLNEWAGLAPAPSPDPEQSCRV